jgi:adenylate kinase
MQIVLLGVTGSGKSALAHHISQQHGWPHISTGAIARQMAADDPATKLMLERGDYAPEGAMRLHVRQQLEAAEVQYGGYVLDGFPRTLAQWICLMQWGAAAPLYLHMDLPLHDALCRLLDRRRHDDIADAIAAKVQAHTRDTQPLIDMLYQSQALQRINGLLATGHQYDYIRAHLLP